MITQPVSYIARIPQLSEVILDGAADLRYWFKALASEGLEPLESSGQASISISATRMQWMGVRFREVVISIPVRSTRGGEVGAFLLQAYNSVPWLAWMEQTFFHTPYLPAEIAGQDTLPTSVRLVQPGHTFLDIRMKTTPPLLRREIELWEGPVFLPTGQARRSQKFYARLGGESSFYAFTGGICEYHAGAPEPVWRDLAESGFHPLQWRIRPAAEHARSKTIYAEYN